jgi:type II secretory pathway component GspD/PulD (secretin)
MKRTITDSPPVAEGSALARAARWLALAACSLGWCAAGSPVAVAQSPGLRAAFDDVHHKIGSGDEASSGEVRLASGELPPPAVGGGARKSPQVRQPNGADATGSMLEGLLPATVPLAGANGDPGLQLTKSGNGLITLIVRDKSLSQVLALIAQTQHLNIVASNDIDALITITLRDVPIEQALTAILSVANYTWVKRNNIILVTSLTDAANLPADVQGRQIQVFDLDFASATVVAETAKNFLSPIGKVSFGISNPSNNRLTQERVVVEDLPDSLARIASYIAQVDQAPRQVLIEAHVLQVNLDSTTRCGVNLSKLVSISGSELNIRTTGFANENAPQAFLATLSGGSLGGVIELIQTTTDAKTLGSPKLLVLNEQEARLQVGEHLGFKVTTTTETSTLESVQFLDVGVVLRIIPRITRDGRVLLHVKPEVSKGAVNPETGLPESQTTELETSVMLNDNQGMIIGGLIKEADSVSQSKVPYLGNVKGVGFLFRRSEIVKERAEIIVALVPRIQPYDCEYQNFEQGELVKASVPLLHGPLLRTDRPWDPVLPDGKRVYYPLVPKKYYPSGHFYGLGPNYVIPPTPLPTQRMCDEECGPWGSSPGDARRGPFAPQEELPLPAPGVEVRDHEIISDRP